MTDDEIIAVVQAHKEGKQIQSRHLEDNIWMNNPSEFQWNFGVYEYRVAPEPRKPREWTLVVDTQTGHVFRARENKLKHPNFENEFVRVREVIE